MLVLASVVAVIFDLLCVRLEGRTSFLYLIWNIFLAWIPYIISSCFIKKDMPANHFVFFFIIWLLFFPNAPYLVTEVLHLVSSSPPFIWYDCVLFFFFGWLGLLLGNISLFHIHQYLRARLTYLFSELSIFAICLISSFGVYLGRFERWNSWDIFVSPLQLVKHSFNLSTNILHLGTPLIFVGVFTIFMYTVYKTVCVLIENKIELI